MGTLLTRLILADPAHRSTSERLATLLSRQTTLSRREADLLIYDYLGHSRSAIAAALNLQVDSLKVYWQRIYRKLACSSRAEARAWVAEMLAEAYHSEGG